MTNKEDFAIVIGISRYPQLRNLIGPVNDAREIVSWLVDPIGGALPQENVQLLVSEEGREPNEEAAHPNRDDVDRAFEKVLKLPVRDDERVGRRLYIYMTGHGYGANSDDVAFLVADASESSLGRSIAARAYADYFRQSGKFDEIVLFVDCGRATSPRVAMPLTPTPPPWVTPVPQHGRDASFFYAYATAHYGEAYETVAEGTERVGGLFTRAIIDGLRGRAAGQDNIVSAQTLHAYLSKPLRKAGGLEQLPSVILGGPSPIIFVNIAPEPAIVGAPEAQADRETSTAEGESIDISSISDAPAEKDTLGFEPYVQAISRFLLSPDTKPPLTLSIEGEWGSGKSSLMLQLKQAVVGESLWRRLRNAWQAKDELSPLSYGGNRTPSRTARLRQAVHQRRRFFVQFNPWRHDREEALWAAFALEFMRQLSLERFILRRWWADLRLFVAHYHWKRGWFEALRAVFLWAVVLVLVIGFPTEIFRKKPRWAEQVLIALSERLRVNQTETASSNRGEGPHDVRAKPIGTTAGAGVGHSEPTPQGRVSATTNVPLGTDNSEIEKTKKEREKPDLDPILKALLLIGGNAAYFAVVLTIWLKAKELIGNPLQVDLKKYLRTPDYEGRVAFVEQFHHDFRKIVDAYAGHEKVFVFIDDLDRCEIPKAADLVKAVNLLIADDPRLIFILGMDREKVAAGLAVKYEKLLPYLAPSKPDGANATQWKQRSGLEYGQAFLEKFIQLPFRVPDPNLENYAEFIKTISAPVKATPTAVGAAQQGDQGTKQAAAPLAAGADNEPRIPTTPETAAKQVPAAPGQPPDAAAAELRRQRELKFQGDSDEVRAIALMIAQTLGPNPRRLKQFINLFRLQAYIVNEVGLFDRGLGQLLPISFPQLGKFVGISLRWPGFLEDWRAEPGLLPGLQELALAKSPALDSASPAAAKWAKEKKLLLLLIYGMSKQNETYTLTNPRLYELLHVCPHRARAPRATDQATSVSA